MANSWFGFLRLQPRHRLEVAAVFFISAIYYLSFCRYGLNIWDEGGIYQGATRYAMGQRSPDDFYGYTSGRYLLTLLSFKLFGDSMLPVRMLYAVLSGLLPMLAYILSRRLMPARFAIFAVALMLVAPAVYYQRFYGFLFLLHAFAILKFLENRNFTLPLLAFLLTVLFKTEVCILVMPAWLYLIYKEPWLEGKKFLLSATAILLMLALLLFSGSGTLVLWHILHEYELWGNSLPVPGQDYQGRPFGFVGFLEAMLFYLPILTGVGLLAVGFLKGGHVGKRFILLALLQLAALALVVSRAGFDNLLRCLPLFFVAAPLAVHLLMQGFGSVGSVGRRVIAATAFTIFICYMVVFNFYNGFYTGSIGAIRDGEMIVKEGKLSGIWMRNDDAEVLFAISDWIEAETSEQDSIFVLPLNPIFYYVTGRQNRTYYDWVLPNTFMEGAEQRLIAELSATQPRLIIFADFAMDGREERRLPAYAPEMMGWIINHYRYAGRVSYFQVWQPERFKVWQPEILLD